MLSPKTAGMPELGNGRDKTSNFQWCEMLLSPAAEVVFVVVVFFKVSLLSLSSAPGQIYFRYLGLALPVPFPRVTSPACALAFVRHALCFRSPRELPLTFPAWGPTFTQPLPVFTFTRACLESPNLAGTTMAALLKTTRSSKTIL